MPRMGCEMVRARTKSEWPTTWTQTGTGKAGLRAAKVGNRDAPEITFPLVSNAAGHREVTSGMGFQLDVV